MIRKILILSGLIVVFFFGEIALTFSDKGNSYILNDQEVAFSLKLENRYSDFAVTEGIDNSVNDFMKRWKIRGMSVAVTKDEELVYAKGFGYANAEKMETVKPGHLFRIASVSKLITAAAIMKLFEEQQLGLDDLVFGPEGILDSSFHNNYRDQRIEMITVRHLLNHTAGWSRLYGDPMFNSLYISEKMDVEPPVEVHHVIDYTLTKKLSFEPGARYSYSNLGYAILGRIIEVKSGIPYEDFVIMNLLKPAGIHDMHIGRSFSHQLYPNEVSYYNTGKTPLINAFDGSGKQVPLYYGGNNIELLAAAGGWVASAPELAKLLVVLDGFDYQRDILKRETLDIMVDPETAGYGLFGWRGKDQSGTWWRTGYLSGSTALLVRQQNGINWVVLMNTSTYRQSHIQRYVSSMMFDALREVDLWPYLNLFLIDQEYPDPLSILSESNPLL